MKTQKITILFCLVLILQSCMKVDEEKFYGKSNPTGYENNYAYVDLGLSVKWATCNVGATSPEGSGNLYAWGETAPKNEYSYENYKWGYYEYKYYNDDYDFVFDYEGNVLKPEDDAATVNMGGKWRMPTKEEMEELCNECFWEYRILNGVEGRSVIGPNGNSIFLPIVYSEFIIHSEIQHSNYNGTDPRFFASYWCSSPECLKCNSWRTEVYSFNDVMYCGLAVRGVLP